MVADIHKLIAAVSPNVYCDSSVRKDVKKIIKKELARGNDKAYLEAAKETKNITSKEFFFYDEALKEPFKKWGIKSPTEQHELIYDSATDSLEPLYFWTIDFMKNYFSKIEKLTDNFTSSPGSGHFSEMGQKATRMQEEAMKMLGAANQVLKSVLNLVYDLKEMKLLVQTYDDIKSKDLKLKSAARLSLKQRWMDMVDIKKGQGSINALASGNLDFVTLRDAFMISNSLKEVKDLDLNERVKRILEQRVGEFLRWIEESERQLRTRYKVEINYLRSQVSTIKLYSRWIKPYLRAARKLEQNAESQQEALVTAFNTILLELTILGYKDYNPKDDVDKGLLPESFAKVKDRKYHPMLIVEFKFRGIPQRVSQRGDWSFGGKTDIKFTSYALNDQELKVLKDQIEKDDLGEAMKLIEGITTESLEEIQKDIDEFLNEDKLPEMKKKEIKEEDTNPFSALFSFIKSSGRKKGKEWDIKQPLESDSEYESIIRSQAIIEARDACFNVFDIYKRAHKMAAHPNPYDPL